MLERCQRVGGLLQQSLSLLALNVGLDLLGAGLALRILMPEGKLSNVIFFLAIFFAVSWFLGGYFYLRWPLMPARRVLLRLLMCVLLALGITFACMIWVLLDRHLLPLLLFAVFFGGWACLQRLWIRLFVRAGISQLIADRCADQVWAGDSPTPMTRELMLLLVAYHPGAEEVDQLQRCLARLPAQIGYAVVVNDHRIGEPVDRIAEGADCFLVNSNNPGYGRSVNQLFRLLLDRPGGAPPYIGIMNTDLSWEEGTFSKLLSWLQAHPQVNLAVPQIIDPSGEVQLLCKHNPTLLGLFSRRFLPQWCKPRWLMRYDQWYVMADQDYQQVFPVTYLSGCCMLVRAAAFHGVGGFDERYFLYLEDADLTRLLSRDGCCAHLPVATVLHNWGKGSYRSRYLTLVNLISAWQYFRKWGWALW